MASKSPRALSHEQIAQKFLDSGAYNFQAMGKLIAEIGPSLAIADRGWHGINFGKYHILACMLTAQDLARVATLNPAIAAAALIEETAAASVQR